MASSAAADPEKKVSNYGTDYDVKAGYWFCTSELQSAGQINSKLFTHLYAGFVKVKCPPGENIKDVIQFPDNYKESFESFPRTVKEKNSGVKALLSIGGGGPYALPLDIKDKDISATNAALVANDDLHKEFIDRSIELATSYDYDGLDLCWLYPASKANQDPAKLTSLLKAWRDAVDKARKINKPKLLLTATVFHHSVIPDATGGAKFTYPSEDIKSNLDWVNVLAVDFYDPVESSTSATGPVHALLDPKGQTSGFGMAGIEKWTANVPSRQLVLGLPFYGHEWTLHDPDVHGFFAPASSAGADCRYLSFKSILNNHVKSNPNNLIYCGSYVAAYWYSHESVWIGFDEEQCISTKVQMAKGKNLRGYFAWHVGADDKWTLSTKAKEAWEST